MAKKKKAVAYKVYDIMQCDKINGKWAKDYARVQRTLKLTKEQADGINENFEASGAFCKVSEKNKEYQALVKEANS